MEIFPAGSRIVDALEVVLVPCIHGVLVVVVDPQIMLLLAELSPRASITELGLLAKML